MIPTIVLIDGEAASGKMVVRSLLDAHADIVVSPIHDMIVDTLLDYPQADRWLEQRDITYLRKLLAASQYYDLERYHLAGGIEFPMSATEVARMPFLFDFYRFDLTWPRRLTQLQKWTLGSVVTEIFESMSECLYPSPLSKPHAYVSVGFDRATTRSSFLSCYPTGKIIYMRRNVEDILAARIMRKPVAGDARSEVIPTLDSLLLKGKVNRILERQRFAESMAMAYPSRVLLIDFDDLVEHTERIMYQVAAFLAIDFAPSLLVGTVMGHELLSLSGAKYIGRILDRASKILTRDELALISLAGQSSFTSYIHYPPHIIVQAVRGWLLKNIRSMRSITANIIAP